MTAGSVENSLAATGMRGSSARAAPALLAPVAATVAALAIHWFVPSRQVTVLTPCYPALLEIVLGVSVVLAIVYAILPRGRVWVRHHAPLIAGAVGLLCAWDLV